MDNATFNVLLTRRQLFGRTSAGIGTEIAKLLALSPATVRTYLRNCYLQLGVKSKVELGSVLRSPGALAESVRRD